MSESPTIRIENHTMTTRDETLLAATLYRPHTPNDIAVLLAGAVGIRQSFYADYATYLAEQGFVVLTFDYRGMGESRSGSVWGTRATLIDWGRQDIQAMLAWLIRQYPGHGIRYIGHSVGGQLLGLAEYADKVDGMMGVATQNVHWSRWSHVLKLFPWMMWYALVPASTVAAGFFPARLFGMGDALPRGVGLEWAAMGRHRYGLLDMVGGTLDNHFAEFTGAMILYSFTDDRMAPRRSVDDFATLFPNADPIQREHVRPVDAGLRHIGHNGFFHSAARESLWKHSAEWLTDFMPEKDQPPADDNTAQRSPAPAPST